MGKRVSGFRRRFSFWKGSVSVLAALLLLGSVFALYTSVGAQMDRHALTGLQSIGVRDCPDDIERRQPSRVVLQYIDGVFHKWEEYDLGKKGEFCIFLRKPEQRRLSVGEGKTLLENSVRWREQGPPAGISEILDPSDPRLQGKPAAPKLPDNFKINNGPASLEPDKPAPPAYPDKESRSGVHPDRVSLPRPEDVVGTDDRTRVTDTTNYSWNTIGYISINSSSINAAHGTGTIVTPHMVLTAGHVVYDLDTGYATSLYFSPGQRQMSAEGAVSRPYGEFTASRFQTNNQYIDALKTSLALSFNYDYAAVFFDTSFKSVGLNTYMPVVFSIAPNSVNLAGYPASVQGETNSKSMWYSSGNVTNVTDRILYYNADTTGGNSGGPVGELVTPGQRRIVAVHVASTPGGCRLVTQNQGIIEAWMAWAPAGSGNGGGTSSSGGGGGCFIATAAYGSYLDPHVQVLRTFRDQFLLRNGPGREFVRLYNHYSPPVSDFIKDREILRIATRILLTPMVYGVKYPLGLLGLCSLVLITGGGVYYTRRRVSSL